MKHRTATAAPERDSACFLDHYKISDEDLAAYMMAEAEKDQPSRAERKRDIRQRRLDRERSKGPIQF